MALAPPGTDAPPVSVDRLPTLTEVVELGTEPDAVVLDEPPVAPVPTAPSAPPPDRNALIEQVLAELVPRIDGLLEMRLREALAPALARAADGLIRDARTELSSTLQDLVREAVARVLQINADR